MRDDDPSHDEPEQKAPLTRDEMGGLVGFPIRPLFDTVFIRRVDTPKSSIIVTPDNAKGSPVEGMVLAVGPGRVTEQGVRVEPLVMPGDHVWFIEGFPAEMVVGGEKVLRMKEADLLAHRRPNLGEFYDLMCAAMSRAIEPMMHESLLQRLAIEPPLLMVELCGISRGVPCLLPKEHAGSCSPGHDPAPSPTEGP